MTNIRNYWGKHFLGLEFVVAILFTILFVLWAEFLSGKNTVNVILTNNRSEIYGTIAAIFGALLGFIITSISIVIGYISDERFKLLREGKYYYQLWGVFKSTIEALALATIISLVGLILDRDVNPNWIILYFNLFSLILVFFRLYRSIWVLENIVNIMSKRP